MADISSYLNAIMKAKFGKDVRGSIHDAIEIINKVGEVQVDTGSKFQNGSPVPDGYFSDSIYINSESNELLKATPNPSGTGMTWVKVGSIQGQKGDDSYTYIKYSQYSDGRDMHDTPEAGDNYIGIYAGDSPEAPDSPSFYKWMFTGVSPIPQKMYIDFATGRLMYEGGALALQIDNSTGHLMWGDANNG